DPAGFTDRERREVVIQHETPLHFSLFEVIHILDVFARPQRRGDYCLSFTSSEQGRTVGARQHPDFDRYRPFLGKSPPVGPGPAVQDVVPENFFLQRIENDAGHLSFIWLVFWMLRNGPLPQLVDQGIAFQLAVLGRVQTVAKLLSYAPLDPRQHFLIELGLYHG